jgi:hypothetical protein
VKARPTRSSPEPEAGDGTADLRLSLRTANPEGTLKILAEIQRRGPSAATLVSDLVPLLQHEDAHVRHAAADALASIGQDVVEPLLKAVLEVYQRLGASGAHSSWAMSWGPYIFAKVGAPAVVPVAENLGHEHAYFWAKVTFQRIALLRAPMSAAADVVLRRLDEVHEEQPLCFVIGAVPALGPDAVRAVPQLIDLLQDPRQNVRTVVVQALGRIGPDAAAALTALERLYRSSRRPWRESLEDAIARIRGER